MLKLMALILLLVNIGYGKEINIVQVGKTFTKDISDETANKILDDPDLEDKYKVKSITVKKGDVLNFANRDEGSHNVRASDGDDEVFDVKLQRPGTKNDKKITLNNKGEFEVKCRIHPKMKMKVKVE